MAVRIHPRSIGRRHALAAAAPVADPVVVPPPPAPPPLLRPPNAEATTVAPSVEPRRAPSVAPSERDRRQRIGWALGPPLAAFLLLRLVFALATPAGILDHDDVTWARYDSGHYRSIALEGYYITPCAARGEVDVTDTCSNAAWYPGYPIAVNVVSSTGLSWHASAVLVAHAATLGVLVMLWNGFLGARPTTRNLLLLLLAAFFPGAVYYLGVFPLSMLTLLLLWQVLLFSRRRWYAGAVVGMVASLFYPISLVLGPVAAAWVWLAEPHGGRRRRLGRAGAVGGLIGVGTATVFVAHQVVLGRWDASLQQQRWFGASLNNPVSSLWEVIVTRDSYMQVIGDGLTKLLAAQTLLVAVMVVAALAVTVVRRTSIGPTEVGLALLVLALWLLPLVNTVDTGLYRRESALVPLVLLLRRAPTWLVGAFVLAAVPLWWLMAEKFYWHVLI